MRSQNDVFKLALCFVRYYCNQLKDGSEKSVEASKAQAAARVLYWVLGGEDPGLTKMAAITPLHHPDDEWIDAMKDRKESVDECIRRLEAEGSGAK